jgi:hypothetical protein
VTAYHLTPETTQFLAERTGQSATASILSAAGGAGKVVQPPEWLAWCLISVGAVLCLHSLAMPRPG